MKKLQNFKTDQMKRLGSSGFLNRKLTKPLTFTVALTLLLSGTACGSKVNAGNVAQGDNAPSTASAGLADAENGQGKSNEDMQQPKTETQAPNGLKFLGIEDGNTSCSTEEGYYYINTEQIKLQDGSYGYRLMYIDYASCREIFLCSDSGCTHDTQDCTAVLPHSEFPAHTSKLFLHQGALYILSRQYDSAGNYSTSFSASGENVLGPTSQMNLMPAALYRMNPDGTGRQKVFSFDPDCTLEGVLAIDQQGLYIISKKLSSQKAGTGEYISSENRALLFLDLSSYSLSQVSAMEFGDDIDWELTGCVNGSFLIQGIDYGRKLTLEEYFEDDEVYQELYKNSYTIYALLDTASGSPREFYRTKNEEIHSTALLGNTLYVSFENSGNILGIDTATGKESLLVTHPQNYISGTIGNMLCCQNLDSFADPSYYFIDTDTGEIRQSRLVNKTVGGSITLIAETESDVHVIYDYDAVKSGDSSYHLNGYLHGLISKEDLFSGKENYRKIEMAGRGY